MRERRPGSSPLEVGLRAECLRNLREGVGRSRCRHRKDSVISFGSVYPDVWLRHLFKAHRSARPEPEESVERLVLMAQMISIVDDDKSVREAESSLVKSLGYVTKTFASAEEFLESGRLRDTACLITDVQMPGMSGVDLQSRLIASGHRTPVIFVTANPDERTKKRALGAGALGFLSKPFSEESLIACLERATGTIR